MAPRVLISDSLSKAAVARFTDLGIDVDYQPKLGKDKTALANAICAYDGLAVRSATKVTDKMLSRAKKLKVIGRAGIGVDNIDIPASSARGVIVMNTPFGNSITTAEHAIAMMMALARQLPEADASTRAGKWEKSKFMGVEITGKTLGIIGCGNIGSIVAERALGLKMKVIAYDPFLSDDKAIELGVRKSDLLELFALADFITLHTPLTDKTHNIIDQSSIAAMRPEVRIINCARGGLVNENALKQALIEGRVAGAAFDVFTDEPAWESVLFDAPNMICTPHLGASTTEAQENVALQIADQMSEYLLTGAVSNAINFPSVSPEEAPRIQPFVQLAEQLGSFAGQLTETGILALKIEYAGDVAYMNTRALTAAAITGMLRPVLQDVNMVSAPEIVRERGINVEESRHDSHGIYGSYIRLTIKTERMERSVAGAVFSDGQPRIIQIKGIDMEAKFARHMLYISNQDQSGFVGALGTTLGQAGVNIATFHLGREHSGGDAIALLAIDEPIKPPILKQLMELPNVVQVKPLSF
jgi:D-3-phosphoglycerate dehydrogenase